MARLFVDSDGVFADFDGHLKKLFGVFPHEVSDDEMWRLIHSDFRFWSEMPLLPGARELWDGIKHANPIVLTGCHKDNYDAIAAEKVVWWNTQFQHEQVITCLSKNKAFHMEQPGDWLVDDMVKNCKRWAKAHGKAIRYTGDWEGTLKVLRQEGVI